jgi:two-component system CheB/CheR fusion protein
MVTPRQKKCENCPELVKASQRAKEADALKNEFLSTISHEIRTPLTGILPSLDLLMDTELTKEQRELLDMVANNSKRLLSLVNDIIDLSKISSGQMLLNFSYCNVDSVLDKVRKNWQREIELRGKDIILEVEPISLEEPLHTDAQRFEQVLNNLLDNAVKFTSKGKVSCGGRQEGDVLHFYVRDTGQGIAENKLNLIFEMFRQVDGSRTRKYGGMGLGLSLCRKIVELLGGKISIESEVDKGSCFEFTIPMEPPESALEYSFPLL